MLFHVSSLTSTCHSYIRKNLKSILYSFLSKLYTQKKKFFLLKNHVKIFYCDLNFFQSMKEIDLRPISAPRKNKLKKKDENKKTKKIVSFSCNYVCEGFIKVSHFCRIWKHRAKNSLGQGRNDGLRQSGDSFDFGLFVKCRGFAVPLCSGRFYASSMLLSLFELRILLLRWKANAGEDFHFFSLD